MTEPLADRVIRGIGQVAELYHRLVMLVAPAGTGKTAALTDVHERATGPLVKVAHENLGQLNIYGSWCRKNMMTDGDNPPAGLLLCPRKASASAGMDNHLFSSKYQLELPSEEAIQRFLEEKIRGADDG